MCDNDGPVVEVFEEIVWRSVRLKGKMQMTKEAKAGLGNVPDLPLSSSRYVPLGGQMTSDTLTLITTNIILYYNRDVLQLELAYL